MLERLVHLDLPLGERRLLLELREHLLQRVLAPLLLHQVDEREAALGEQLHHLERPIVHLDRRRGAGHRAAERGQPLPIEPKTSKMIWRAVRHCGGAAGVGHSHDRHAKFAEMNLAPEEHFFRSAARDRHAPARIPQRAALPACSQCAAMDFLSGGDSSGARSRPERRTKTSPAVTSSRSAGYADAAADDAVDVAVDGLRRRRAATTRSASGSSRRSSSAGSSSSGWRRRRSCVPRRTRRSPRCSRRASS